MNTRINELAIQAGGIWRGGFVDHPNGSSVYTDRKFVHGGDMDVEQFARLLVKECSELVKARLNHIPDNQDDWDGHNYGETAAVYGILDTFREHFGVEE
jgi:hypothetical protein